MTGKFINRVIRRRFQAALIWVMMPVALINGRMVSGCMSPTGHFEPGCHCQAMQESNACDQAKTNTTCQCHCACCHGGTCCCCCKAKTSCCKSVASNAVRVHGNGFQSGDHCRPFSTYAVTPVVKTAVQVADAHQLTDIAVVLFDLPLSVLPTTFTQVAELNTGPPPDNLVVALHRFLI